MDDPPAKVGRARQAEYADLRRLGKAEKGAEEEPSRPWGAVSGAEDDVVAEGEWPRR
jgi:hypothetical protein